MFLRLHQKRNFIMSVWFLLVLVLCLGLASFGTAAEKKETPQGREIHWKKVAVNAEAKFEAAGIGDINKDGKPDIISGSYWYEAPTWTKHLISEIQASGTYFNDFCDLPQDVDGDGDLDVVSVTWFSQEVFWRENPGAADRPWATHSVDKPGNMETALLVDLNGDGVGDLLPNVMNEVVWYEKQAPKKDAPLWIKRSLGKDGAGHGIGVGDVNRDGAVDILTPNGWYEGKKSGRETTWTWHPEFKDLKLGSTSVPILVDDVNGDGRNDVIWGMGHDYGIYWLEQVEVNGKREWKRHEIDHSWSQPHYIAYVDLQGDGRKELVTGKRYMAHDGHDPGELEPLCIYFYTYNPAEKRWDRSVIDQGTKTGFGLSPAVGDIDGDGDIDLVCPGKSGLFLLIQE